MITVRLHGIAGEAGDTQHEALSWAWGSVHHDMWTKGWGVLPPCPQQPSLLCPPGAGTQPPVSGDSGGVFLLRLQGHGRRPAHYPLLEARQPWGSASGSVKHQDHSSEAKSHQGRWAGIRTSSGGGGQG